MMGCVGLISRILLARMYSISLESRICALMIFSILADHPNLPATSTHGELSRRLDTWTLET